MYPTLERELPLDPLPDVPSGLPVAPPPAVQPEGGPSSQVEHNVAVAALLAACAGVLDAVGAFDPGHGSVSAPASLRVCSAVLIAALGAPAIGNFSLVEQRMVFAALLATAAYLGTHTADERLRAGDAAYTGFVLLVMVRTVASGGVEGGHARPDALENATRPHRKQSTAATFAAIVFYVACRGMVAALTHARTALNFSTTYSVLGERVSTHGYATSTPSAAAALSFGYGVCAAAALVVLTHRNATLLGSHAVAFEVAVSGAAAAAAGAVALVRGGLRIDELGVLYNSAACAGGRNVCEEAARARRFAACNVNPGPLFLLALALLVCGLPTDRLSKDATPSRHERLWRKDWTIAGLVLALATAAAVASVMSMQGVLWHTEFAALATVAAVYLCSTGDSLFGSALYLVFSIYEEYKLVYEYGAWRTYNQPTHITLVFCIGLLATHLVAEGCIRIMERFFEVSDSSVLRHVTALTATVGTALSAALYCASAVLLSAQSGQLPSDIEVLRDNGGGRTAVAFLTNHFTPLLLWIPLYVCRPCSPSRMDKWTRSAVWVASAPVWAVAYSTAVNLLGSAGSAVQSIEPSTTAVAAVAMLFPWTTAATL